MGDQPRAHATIRDYADSRGSGIGIQSKLFAYHAGVPAHIIQVDSSFDTCLGDGEIVIIGYRAKRNIIPLKSSFERGNISHLELKWLDDSLIRQSVDPLGRCLSGFKINICERDPDGLAEADQIVSGCGPLAADTKDNLVIGWLGCWH